MRDFSAEEGLLFIMSEATGPIEGYYIESVEGLFFAVKGLFHPPEVVVAYLRYVLDPLGERKKKGLRYRRVYHFEEQERLLREKYPAYLFSDLILGGQLQGVSHQRIRQIYDPCLKPAELRSRENLDEVEKNALEFTELLRDTAGVSKRCLGISGSILLGLHIPQSDIDVVVYGVDNCWAVHKTLRRMLAEPSSGVEKLNRRELEELYTFRSQDTPMPFQDFLRLERRKVIQGKFQSRGYFIRFIKTPSEVGERYGDRRCTCLGLARVEATVTDAKEAIFTPCTYGIDDVKFIEGKEVSTLKELSSFRGRFCEQAKEGERIAAHGKLERVSLKDGSVYHRLLIGKPGSGIVVRSSQVDDL